MNKARVEFAECVTGEVLAEAEVAVVPRDGEFVRLGGRTYKVFDIEHVLSQTYETLPHLKHVYGVQKVIVRLSAFPQ